MPKMHYFV